MRILGKVETKRIEAIGDNEITIYSPYTLTAYSIPIIGKWINSISGIWVRYFMQRQHIEPDVFYSHFWRAGLWTYKVAKRQGKPLFVASGESVISMTNNGSRINEYTNYVKGVICVSTKNKNESVKNMLTNPDKCIVLPNAIDSSLFYKKDKAELRRKFGYSKNDFIVAFVGYFCDRKGSKRLSDAIEKLADASIKSIFIGSIREKDSAPTCNGIIYKGALPHNQIPDYLNCADVFVLPTLFEGCCNAIIEAMACGLPIISSDRDFNYDVLDDTCAILIDPTSVVAIADAIKQIKDNSIMRNKLSEGALDKAKNLSIATRASKIIDFMNSFNI